MAGAEECVACVEFASRAVASAAIRDHGDDLHGAGGQGGDGEEDTSAKASSEGADDGMDIGPPTTPPPKDGADEELELAAFSFLTELVRTSTFCKSFLKDSTLLRFVSVLSQKSESAGMRRAAVDFLVKLAPFVDCSNDGGGNGNGGAPLSSCRLGAIFCSLLGADEAAIAANDEVSAATGFMSRRKAATTTSKLSRDRADDLLVPALAASGLGCVFHEIPEAQRIKALGALSSQFTRAVDTSWTGSKSSVRAPVPQTNGGLLCCNVTAVFLEVLGDRPCREAILQPRLVSAMLRLVMIKIGNGILNAKDQKQPSADEEDDLLWDASVAHCLQCLSILSRPNSSGSLLGSSWEELISSAEAVTWDSLTKKRGARQVARVFKEAGLEDAKKPMTFRSVLGRVAADRANPAVSVASKRILDQISN